MAEIIVGVLFEIMTAALGMLMIQTGRAVVWLVSCGKWRSELLFGHEARIHGAAGALSFVRDGQRVMTETGLLFIGIAFYLPLAVTGLAIFATA